MSKIRQDMKANKWKANDRLKNKKHLWIKHNDLKGFKYGITKMPERWQTLFKCSVHGAVTYELYMLL